MLSDSARGVQHHDFSNYNVPALARPCKTANKHPPSVVLVVVAVAHELGSVPTVVVVAGVGVGAAGSQRVIHPATIV